MKFKKYKILIAIALLVPSTAPIFYVFFGPETRVCGVDNKTYGSMQHLEANKVELNYDFPCENPKSEKDLYERTEEIEVVGMLSDFYKGDEFSQLILRSNQKNKDYLLRYERQDLELDTFLPGDQIRVSGRVNKNTELINANRIVNLSLKDSGQETLDCNITEIDTSSRELSCDTDKGLMVFSYNNDTRIVAGLTNPAQIEDIKDNDHVRIRALDKLAKTILVAKRGKTLFLKNRSFIALAKFTSINKERELIKAKLLDYPEEVRGVMLIDENTGIDIKYNDNTRMVKKYFGFSDLSDLRVGHELYVMGRLRDDGVFEAMTIKNNTIWK